MVISLKLNSLWMLLQQLRDVLTQPQTKAEEVLGKHPLRKAKLDQAGYKPLVAL